MTVGNNIREVVYRSGFKSLLEFSAEKKINYYFLRKVANNKATNINCQFLIELCAALNCEVGDLLYINKEDKQ